MIIGSRGSKASNALAVAGPFLAASGTLSALTSPVFLVVLPMGVLFLWTMVNADRSIYLLFAFMFFYPVTTKLPGIPGKPLTGSLAVVALISVLGIVQRKGVRRNRGLWVIAAVGFLVFISIPNWPGFGMMQLAMRSYIAYGLAAWRISLEFRHNPARLRRVAQSMSWVGVPLLLLALYEAETKTWPLLDKYSVARGYTSLASADRPSALMGHAIVYGMFCMAGVLVAFTLRGKCWQIPFVFNLIGLTLSGSRSTWLGALAAFAALYLIRSRRITARGINSVVGLALVSLVLALWSPAPIMKIISTAQQRLSGSGTTSSVQARSLRVQIAWDAIFHSPNPVQWLTGYGPRGDAIFFAGSDNLFGDHLAQAFDNTYLFTAYDFGVLATMALAALLILSIIRHWRSPGAYLLLAFGVSIYFFDVYAWPCAVAVGLLGYALTPRTTAVVPIADAERQVVAKPAGSHHGTYAVHSSTQST
jgi:hypothetical protein